MRSAALAEVSDLASLVSRLPSLEEVQRRQEQHQSLKAEFEEHKKAYQLLMGQYTHLLEQAEKMRADPNSIQSNYHTSHVGKGVHESSTD